MTLQEHLKESFDRNFRKHYGGGLDFKEVESGTGYNWIYEAMKAAISEACRKQREICAEGAVIYLNDDYEFQIDTDSIKNAPEPPLL